MSFESGGATINTNKGETTIALNGSDYKMASEPGKVYENLAKVKKIQEEANEKIEPKNNQSML